MFGRRLQIFKLLGIPVRVDWSWAIIALLVTWSLAVNVFAPRYSDLSARVLWAMGICGMLGLFTSIVIHEFSHALIARRFGIPMRGITLFVFGGVAEMDEEPPSGKAEFFMAVAGPAASVVVAIVCFALSAAGRDYAWPTPVRGVLGYLGWINLVLVAFNLIPAFPLDGGRVLRAALWAWKGQLRWATRVSSRIGSMFGIALILLGILAFVTGSFVSGMWWVVIGFFLRSTAHRSYQGLVVRQALEGQTVERLMQRDPVTVAPDTTIAELVENYVYSRPFKMYPVVDGDRVLGCVTIQAAGRVPRNDWDRVTVGTILQECSPNNTIAPGADALTALSKMNRTRLSRLLVVEDGRLAGILALKDLLQLLSVKIELGNQTGWLPDRER